MEMQLFKLYCILLAQTVSEGICREGVEDGLKTCIVRCSQRDLEKRTHF